ncbi:MAG: TRAP transporter small permease subunit [Ectothiorhodospiraceae bacterium]|nr:TRAP transporter small permease subunit [Ectothiorhodospiraceae bacterium]
MRALQAVMRAVTWLNDRLGSWVSYLVFFMFVFLLLEVFFRYMLRSPTVWTVELTQMLFGAYAVLAGGYLMAHNGHVSVDILYMRFPPRVKAAVDIFTSILFFLFLGVLLWFGSQLAWESLERLETSQSAWNPPLYPVKLMIPLGAGLLLLQGIVKLLNDIFILLNIGQVLPQDSDDAPGENQL